MLDTNIKGYEQFTLDVSGRIESPIKSFPTVLHLQDIDDSDIVLVSRIGELFDVVSVTQEQNSLAWKESNDSDDDKTVSLSLENPNSKISKDKPINIKVRFIQSDKSYDLPIKAIL